MINRRSGVRSPHCLPGGTMNRCTHQLTAYAGKQTIGRIAGTSPAIGI